MATKINDRSFSETTVVQAHEVWKTMHDEAVRRGMALTRFKGFGDGRVIIRTTSAFIEILSSERNWNLTKSDKDLIRRYLKASGNVVTLEKIENYQFRIFIREEWSNAALVPPKKDSKTPDPIMERAKRLSPEEAGETREPGVVIYNCVHCPEDGPWYSQEEFDKHRRSHLSSPPSEEPQQESSDMPLDHDRFPLGRKAALLLMTLGSVPGQTVADSSGYATNKLMEHVTETIRSPAASINTLVERGLVEVKRRGKRTFFIELTDKGNEVYRNINAHRTANDVVAEYLSAVGEIQAENVFDVVEQALSFNRDRIRGALNDLLQDGKIKRTKSGPGHNQVWTSVEWVGEKVEPLASFVPPVEEVPQRGLIEPRAVEQAPIDTVPRSQISSDELLQELSTRLAVVDQLNLLIDQRGELAEKNEQMIDLISQIIEDANNGKLSPLKALADIQETLTL